MDKFDEVEDTVNMMVSQVPAEEAAPPKKNTSATTTEVKAAPDQGEFTSPSRLPSPDVETDAELLQVASKGEVESTAEWTSPDPAAPLPSMPLRRATSAEPANPSMITSEMKGVPEPEHQLLLSERVESAKKPSSRKDEHKSDSPEHKSNPPGNKRPTLSKAVEARLISKEEQEDLIALPEDFAARQWVDQSWTGMQEKFDFLWRAVSKRFFSEISISQERQEHLHEAEKEGTVVYVMRNRSYLNYLIFNDVSLRYGLPLSRMAAGLNWIIWHPFFKQLRIWFKRFGRILGFGGKSADEIFEGLVRNDQASMIFLRRPNTLFSYVRKGVYKLRDSVRSLFKLPEAPGGKAQDHFVELVKIQRSQEQPIFLCPQMMVWDRNPTQSNRSIWDALFGEKEFPGTLRELYLFLRDRRTSRLRGGNPFNLKELLEEAEYKKLSDEHAGEKVRALLEERLESEYRAATGPILRSPQEVKNIIVHSRRIQDSIHRLAEEGHGTPEQLREKAHQNLDQIVSDLRLDTARWVDLLLRFFWERIYKGIHIDEEGLERVREAAVKAPLVLIPNHKSYIDFLVLSQVFFHYDLGMPHIVAGDNLNMPVVGKILRRCGAFFMRRSFRDDPLYKDVFNEYINYLLRSGHTVEFFIEGARSRTGKLRQPKMGILSYIANAVLENHVEDLNVVPISLAYDRIIEGETYSKELLGGEKRKERLIDIFKARNLLGLDFGRVKVEFGAPISMKKYIEGFAEQERKLHGKVDFDPVVDRKDRKQMIRSLAYQILFDINRASIISPTAIIATLLLANAKRGLNREEMTKEFEWLREELLFRKARMTQSDDVETVVEDTLRFLNKMLKEPGDTLYPVYRAKESRRLELGFYRNQLIHLFVSEGVVACALWSFRELQYPRASINRQQLLDRVRFLSKILKHEFVYKPSPDIAENLDATIQRMSWRGMILLKDDQILLRDPNQKMLQFLRLLFWPFVDSYWMASLSLLSLSTGEKRDEKEFIADMQKLAQTLYHEGSLKYSDAVSKETLQTALNLLQELGMLETSYEQKGRRSHKMRSIPEGSQDLKELLSFANDLGQYTSCEDVDGTLEQVLHLHQLKPPTS
jgi:glycerol-3-phosphate O-acyltransferase